MESDTKSSLASLRASATFLLPTRPDEMLELSQRTAETENNKEREQRREKETELK